MATCKSKQEVNYQVEETMFRLKCIHCCASTRNNRSKIRHAIAKTQLFKICEERETILVLHIVVGGCHFWLFFLVFYRRLNVHYVNTLYVTYIFYVYIHLHTFSGPPAMTKGRPPPTMVLRNAVGLGVVMLFSKVNRITWRCFDPMTTHALGLT